MRLSISVSYGGGPSGMLGREVIARGEHESTAVGVRVVVRQAPRGYLAGLALVEIAICERPRASLKQLCSFCLVQIFHNSVPCRRPGNPSLPDAAGRDVSYWKYR